MGIVHWVMERLVEPSSYAAVAGGGVGLGVLLGLDILIIIGIAAGVLGIVLREKELIL